MIGVAPCTHLPQATVEAEARSPSSPARRQQKRSLLGTPGLPGRESCEVMCAGLLGARATPASPGVFSLLDGGLTRAQAESPIADGEALGVLRALATGGGVARLDIGLCGKAGGCVQDYNGHLKDDTTRLPATAMVLGRWAARKLRMAHPGASFNAIGFSVDNVSPMHTGGSQCQICLSVRAVLKRI